MDCATWVADMFTVKQTATILTISVASVYALIAARKIRHERYGLGRGTIRIPGDAIEQYRQRCTTGEAIAPPPKRQKLRLRHLRV